MRTCMTIAGTKKLFKMMLGTDSEFVNKFFQARKYWDINVGQWTAVGMISQKVSTLLACMHIVHPNS